MMGNVGHVNVSGVCVDQSQHNNPIQFEKIGDESVNILAVGSDVLKLKEHRIQNYNGKRDKRVARDDEEDKEPKP
uniref:Gag-pol polyprotein n=1 Tax=Globodera pallida TaxID=36090 RepID=A0A183C903_GLOPA